MMKRNVVGRTVAAETSTPNPWDRGPRYEQDVAKGHCGWHYGYRT